MNQTSSATSRSAMARREEMLHRARLSKHSESGAALILVLWVAFGLVSLALYFGQSMAVELRASENRTAALQADQAIEGAARYISYVLAQSPTPGRMLPDEDYQREAVAVGEAYFWILGRTNSLTTLTTPVFRLVDEASKLSVNSSTIPMLEMLPLMTSEFAAAIVDWRDTNSTVSTGGAEEETYLQRNPAYFCKNNNFETVDELRLVFGSELQILYGEDANLNGVLDPNENDADVSPPYDNRDGKLDSGILNFVTVYSREPNTRTNGAQRINVANRQGGGPQADNALRTLLQEKSFPPNRVNQILEATREAQGVLDFYRLSGMTEDEFAGIESDITGSAGQFVQGRINVNTASEEVLACIPGIGMEKAGSMVAYRQSNPDKLTSIAWVRNVLDAADIRQLRDRVTVRSYQFSADIAAVGRYGRGYRRVRFIFDTSEGTPKIVYRQDLGHLGWALGPDVHQRLQLAAMNTR